jgi:hypothetical protein
VKPAAVIGEVRESLGDVTIVCDTGLEGSAELLFARGDAVVHRLPVTSDDGRVCARFGATDLPGTAGRYRMAIAIGGEQLPIIRNRNDILLEDRTSVLMPLVIDDEHQTAGRLQFNRSGELFVVRRVASSEVGAEALR